VLLTGDKLVVKGGHEGSGKYTEKGRQAESSSDDQKLTENQLVNAPVWLIPDGDLSTTKFDAALFAWMKAKSRSAIGLHSCSTQRRPTEFFLTLFIFLGHCSFDCLGG